MFLCTMHGLIKIIGQNFMYRPPLNHTILALSIFSIFSGCLYAAENQCAQPNKNGRFASVSRAQDTGMPPPNNEAIRLTADDIQGISTIEAHATGDVIVERNDQIINAAELHYTQQNNRFVSRGDFTLSNAFANMQGRDIDYNIVNKTGKAHDVRFVNTDANGKRLQGEAKTVEMFGSSYHRMNQAIVNTCEENDDSWYIKAKQVDANQAENIGVAKNATLVFQGVPLLYSPWLDFPLKGGRKSGFLTPTIGGGSNGFELAMPYYMNLAPNYDATITPYYYSRRGLSVIGEGRYLYENFSGSLNAQFLPNDQVRKEERNRSVFHWQHQQKLSDKISLSAEYHRASDNDFYRDLGNRLDTAENIHLPQYVSLTHQDQLLGGTWENTLEVRQYQTLQNKQNTLDTPYKMMPRISSRWAKNTRNAQLAVWGEITRFEHSQKQEGWREILYPSITWNLANDWGYIRPKLALHATAYQLNAWEDKPKDKLTRVLPIVSVDSGVTFERETNILKTPMLQTLEPRVFYTYIPSKDQSHLPNFDTSENHFTYDQLFRENRFSGHDRINPAHQITTAVSTAFYSQNNGNERFRAGMGQRFYFKKDDLTLSGQKQERMKNRSDFLAFFNGQLMPSFYVDGNWHYNNNQNRTDSYSAGLRWQPQDNKIVALRFGYDRESDWYVDRQDELKYIDVALQYPIYKGWAVVARNNYSLTEKKNLDSLLGVHYDAQCGCWSSTLFFQRYITDFDKTKNAFFFRLQLRGLGELGKAGQDELRRAIPGYRTFSNQ